MRSVAVMLLVFTSLSAMRASTDRGAAAHAVRSNPRRLLLISIASPCRPSPSSPTRRPDAIESALDEEEASDLNPLDSPPRTAAVEHLSRPDTGPFSIGPASSSGAGRTRSRLLRC
ncbi:MAG TPA: hypothetical protein VGH33_19860 [Isosphaeraceae bacterium]|jgi:hypothetical protein